MSAPRIGKRRVWSASDLRTLSEMRGTCSIRQIADRLGRSEKAVGLKLFKLRHSSHKAIRGVWSEADIEALYELRATCTTAQIAAYLNRSENAVLLKLTKLRNEGHPIQRARTGPGRSNPFFIPKGRGRLVAKTCPKCGLIRDAAFFGYKDGAYSSECKPCRADLRDDHGAEQPYYQNAALLQEITYAQASNERQRYNESDLIEVKDVSRSEFEVALSLGRTYYAICNKRRRMGLGPYGTKPKRGNFDKRQHWSITFPAAAETLRVRMFELGITAPEALYGIDPAWVDEVES